MPILLLVEGGSQACTQLPAGLRCASKPAAADLGELGSASVRETCGEALCEAVAAATGSLDRASAVPEPCAVAESPIPESVRALLERASREFERVAIFWVGDGEAVGLAQSGLAVAGGPDDSGLRRVRIPIREPAWFRAALESGRGVRCGPQGEGDRRLAAHLGEVMAPEAWVAPVTAEGRIIALLYADNLPAAEPLPEPEVLENVLREVGRDPEPAPETPSSGR